MPREGYLYSLRCPYQFAFGNGTHGIRALWRGIYLAGCRLAFGGYPCPSGLHTPVGAYRRHHAWVEAWADGKWYFLGACEPEPVLNLGWFNAPASRGMLMRTKVFGRYEGAEEVMSVTPTYTEINVIGNYAPTARATVTVMDGHGNPVSDACVEFKLYNYAEFYTVARKQTDAEGKAF